MKRDELVSALQCGLVIPAHPLALTAERRLDERHQRALARYYLAAGAGGLAVGVHTTQFAIHDPDVGLLRPVLELASETAKEFPDQRLLIAGAVGATHQAVAEAELAASLGYDAVLLSPLTGVSEGAAIDRARAVADVLPLIGFYLQEAVGGPIMSQRFWHEFVTIPNVVAIKAAPFNRYRTLDVARAIAESHRDDIALYTGNDDTIIADLLTTFRFGERELTVAGGLLGQWAVWTRSAVKLLDDAKQARSGDLLMMASLIDRVADLTDANAAVFDAANNFAGVIAGVHEVLHRQGLLEGIWCLDPAETLSLGQSDELTRVSKAYPWLLDDEFVAEHRDEWLR